MPFPIKGQIVTQLKRGSNVFEIFLVCPQNNNWVGSHKRSREALRMLTRRTKGSLLENGAIQSFQFNVIDWQAQKPVSAIRDYQLIRDNTEHQCILMKQKAYQIYGYGKLAPVVSSKMLQHASSAAMKTKQVQRRCSEPWIHRHRTD